MGLRSIWINAKTSNAFSCGKRRRCPSHKEVKPPHGNVLRNICTKQEIENGVCRQQMRWVALWLVRQRGLRLSSLCENSSQFSCNKDVSPVPRQWKSVKWEGIRDVILMSGEATAGSGIPLIKFGIRGGAGMTIDNRVERWR